VGKLGLRVVDCLALCPHSLNELGEVLHDDSSANTVGVINVI